MSQPKYQPKQGTEEYVHVEVTHKQGQELPKPIVEQYHPAQFAEVSKLVGFKGKVLHDPRTTAEQQEPAPAANTVKTSATLETDEQYRARYRELFRDDAPSGMLPERVKQIVDGAEKKLADNLTGQEPVDGLVSSEPNTDADPNKPSDNDPPKLPTEKKDWYELYKTHQTEQAAEAKAYDDITVAQIRDILGK